MKYDTTGSIAKLCKVSPRTVTKWIDTGLLKGRLIPGSRDRRVDRKDLDAFLLFHNMTFAIYELKLSDLL